MAVPIVEELKGLVEEGMITHDAFLQEEVLIVAPVICVVSDNPRTSEITNNLKPSARLPCRMCMVSNPCQVE